MKQVWWWWWWGATTTIIIIIIADTSIRNFLHSILSAQQCIRIHEKRCNSLSDKRRQGHEEKTKQRANEREKKRWNVFVKGVPLVVVNIVAVHRRGLDAAASIARNTRAKLRWTDEGRTDEKGVEQDSVHLGCCCCCWKKGAHDVLHRQRSSWSSEANVMADEARVDASLTNVRRHSSLASR